MLPFDRADYPPPACLSDERGEAARRLLADIFSTDSKMVSQTRISMREVTVEGDELDYAVERLFRGQCAFCETRDKVRAYRFRPGEEAGPASAAPARDAERSHLYYCWLINSWQNVYAICEGCRPLEPSIFPTTGSRCPLPEGSDIHSFVVEPVGSWPGRIDERPVLLDPCANDDFRKHIAALPDGSLVGLSARGDFTINHYNLNRPGLLERRAVTFRRHLAGLLHAARNRNSVSALFAFETMEHGGTWFLLLYQIALRLGGGGGARPTLSRLRIGRYYSERLTRPGVADLVEGIFEDMLADPGEISKDRSRPAPTVHGEARPVSFTIKNFKSLENLEIRLNARQDQQSQDPVSPTIEGSAPMAPALVILGENAVGKSSILEAMALVLAHANVRKDLKQDASKFMLNPAWLGGANGTKLRRGTVRVEYENNDVAEIHIRPEFPFKVGESIPRIPVFAYGAFRLFLDAEKKSRPATAIRSLFESNYVLPNPSKWLASLAGTPQFEEVARALKYILAIDQKVDIIRFDEATGECLLLTNVQRAEGQPIELGTPLSGVSSGFRAILAMVCDVMRGLIAIQDKLSASLARARAVVLIDEVEAHLHPKWKMQIIQGLRQALPNVTFIVTTHDPLCLRGLAPDEVRVFRRANRVVRSGKDVLPVQIEQVDDLPAIGTLTIEQLLTSDLFNLHNTDSPALEKDLAMAGDLLAREKKGGVPSEQEAALGRVRDALRTQIRGALPVGSTEVERMVQDAVAEYLIKRRSTSADQLRDLRETTRAKIVKALDDI